MEQIDFDDEGVRTAFVATHLDAIELLRRWRPIVRGRGDRWERDVSNLNIARRQLADAWADEDVPAFHITRDDIIAILGDLLGPDASTMDDPS